MASHRENSVLGPRLASHLGLQSAEVRRGKRQKWLRADQTCWNLVFVCGQLGHPWIRITTDQAEKSQEGVTLEK